MRSKKEGYKGHIRKTRRRRKLIRLSVSLFAYIVKIILTALVVLFLMKASAAPEKEAAGQQAKASEAPVLCADARQQAAPQQGRERAAGPSFVPLDVPMAEEDQKAIYDICNDYKIAFTLVMAMIEHESGFDAAARSNTGDSGLMQINDCNSARLAEMGLKDLFDIRENVVGRLYASGVVQQIRRSGSRLDVLQHGRSRRREAMGSRDLFFVLRLRSNGPRS